jgi:hypothetical protein
MRVSTAFVSCIIAILASTNVWAQQKPNSGLDLPISPPPLINSGSEDITPPDDDGDNGDDPTDTPPPVFYGEELESENDTIFYVMDISCSMGWGEYPYITMDAQRNTGPRIERAKAELARSVISLSDNFLFNIIAYDCSVRQWSPEMQPADAEHKANAISWIFRLQPIGATGTGPATSQALSVKDNMLVVLLTDGIPNCGADGFDGHRIMIRNANTQGAAINVFGIAASGSYRAFCQGVASDSGGCYFDVP